MLRLGLGNVMDFTWTSAFYQIVRMILSAIVIVAGGMFYCYVMGFDFKTTQLEGGASRCFDCWVSVQFFDLWIAGIGRRYDDEWIENLGKKNKDI